MIKIKFNKINKLNKKTLINYFILYINNKFISCGEYLIKGIIDYYSNNFIQIKLEKEYLIILKDNYLAVEKIDINNGLYTFTNIISQKLYEKPFKILNDNKFVTFDHDIFKISQILIETKTIKCLFKISYNIFKSKLVFKNKFSNKHYFKNEEEERKEEEEREEEEKEEGKEEEEEEEKEEEKEEEEKVEVEEEIDKKAYELENVEKAGTYISNKLCDIIEIKEKNIIIASFSKEKYINTHDDYDYTFGKYGILIIDSINYQIKTNICNLIEAEKLFYFGNNELYSFGIRKFFKLNLKKIKLECIENETKRHGYCCHYYHYNFIPFLKVNKIFCFGYYRCGTWYSRDEHRHLCLYDISNNTFNDIYYDNYDIEYFPLKIDNDKILIIENYEMSLFKLKIIEK